MQARMVHGRREGPRARLHEGLARLAHHDLKGVLGPRRGMKRIPERVHHCGGQDRGSLHGGNRGEGDWREAPC